MKTPPDDHAPTCECSGCERARNFAIAETGPALNEAVREAYGLLVSTSFAHDRAKAAYEKAMAKWDAWRKVNTKGTNDAS